MISAATRADYARAAAVVLSGDGPTGVAYELGGDEAFTMADFAAEVSKQGDRPVVYQNLSLGEYTAALVGFGLPEPVAEVLASADAGVARGDLHDTSGTLSALIGRPTTPLREVVAAALG